MSTTVKLSKDLASRIDKYVGHYGYKSRTEIVADAVEHFLKKLEGEELPAR